MALLDEIVEGAASETMPLGTLLRKCLILVSRLGSKPAADWVEWELNGYPNDSPIPSYREVPLTIKLNMAGYGMKATDYALPSCLLGKSEKQWTSLGVRFGIGAIEHTLQKSNGSISFQNGSLQPYLASLELTTMPILSAWCETHTSSYKHILDTVRNRVLKFALELGREYPDAGGVEGHMTIEAGKESERANQIFYQTIYGHANVVGTALNSTVTLNVLAGDFPSLQQTLARSGVPQQEISELQRAILAEPNPGAGRFGPKVSAWIGKMMRKAADGTWKIATGAAGQLLGDAIARYYGVK